MLQWKPPPKAKVYEALSAVLDGRVTLKEDGEANVPSSGRDKSYTVRWTDGTNQIQSNDNASFFQGYIGYPIIAVLLATHRLSFDAELAKPLAGVPWNALNKSFKRDYDAAVNQVLTDAKLSPNHRESLEKMVDQIRQNLIDLNLERPAGRSVRPPGK